MFGFLRKKRPANALDQFIFAVYGNPPPPKRANLQEAIALARDDLLAGGVEEREVRTVAQGLSAGPIPYSTHDLALSVAMNLFKRPELHRVLSETQITARVTMISWLQAGLVAPAIAKFFEETLYKLYKQESTANPTPPAQQIQEAYVAGMSTVIKTQLMLASTDPIQASGDLWAGGYIYGAHCALLQYHGLTVSDASVELMELSYAAMFPTVESGAMALRSIMNRAVQADADFALGVECGMTDIADWCSAGKTPIGLTGRLLR